MKRSMMLSSKSGERKRDESGSVINFTLSSFDADRTRVRMIDVSITPNEFFNRREPLT